MKFPYLASGILPFDFRPDANGVPVPIFVLGVGWHGRRQYHYAYSDFGGHPEPFHHKWEWRVTDEIDPRNTAFAEFVEETAHLRDPSQDPLDMNSRRVEHTFNYKDIHGKLSRREYVAMESRDTKYTCFLVQTDLSRFRWHEQVIRTKGNEVNGLRIFTFAELQAMIQTFSGYAFTRPARNYHEMLKVIANCQSLRRAFRRTLKANRRALESLRPPRRLGRPSVLKVQEILDNARIFAPARSCLWPPIITPWMLCPQERLCAVVVAKALVHIDRTPE